MYALSRDAVEFPAELAEQRIHRLVERGLSLQEATSAEEQERSKLVPLHILRPCLGKGRGRHVYEANMLQENAHKFAGLAAVHRPPVTRSAQSRQGPAALDP